MNNNMKDEDILPLSPEEIKAIGSIGIGPSKQDIFLNRHYRKLILAGIVVATAAGVAIAYFSTQNDRKSEAGAQVVAAMGTQVPAVAHPASAYSAKAIELLEADYAGTPSTATAQLLEGLSLLSGTEEQAKAGLATLDAVANDTKAPAILRARALVALANHAMGKGDDATAATHWNAVLTLGESPYLALAYLTLGDIAKAAGKVDEARRNYQQAVNGCVTSQLVLDPNIIAMRLQQLDVDAPRPVSPAEEKPAAGAAGASPLDSPFDDAPTPAVPTGDSLFDGGSTMQDSLPAPMPEDAKKDLIN